MLDILLNRYKIDGVIQSLTKASTGKEKYMLNENVSGCHIGSDLFHLVEYSAGAARWHAHRQCTIAS